MRLTTCLLGLSIVSACASTTQPQSTISSKSYSEHIAAADAHDQRAAQHERAILVHGRSGTSSYRCGDLVLGDQAYSGTEKIGLSTPCWDPDEESAQHHASAAHKQRQIARDERRAAASLVETEVVACRQIPEAELAHSPFVHQRAISEVEPHFVAGKVRGARVVFRRIPGLTEEWLRRDIECHQARFGTLGGSPTYLPGDPTLVPNATVKVVGDRNTITVVIEVADDEAADVASDEVLSRAKALIPPPRTASRR